MDTKYKTEATERKAPDISVCAHLDETTRVSAETAAGENGVWLGVSGFTYPSVSFFMSRDKLAEIRDTITAYLDETE